ncbi:MAG: ABC transporter ATP-binding protein [Bdellovibrionales bacterium]
MLKKAVNKLSDSFASTARGLALAWKASPRLGIAISLLTTVSALLPPLMAYVGKLIIDAVVAQSIERTTKMVLAEFALIAGISIVQRLLFLARTLLGNRLGITVNSMILEKASQLSLAQIENSEFYDKLNRARQEASSRSLQMVTDSFQFIQNALTLFAYISLLFAYSHWAVLALVIASIPATWAEMFFSNVGFRLYNWRSPERRKLSYMEYVLANDQHAKELRVFNLGGRFLERYRGLAEKFYKEDSALSTRRTMWIIFLSFLSSGAFYACYLTIAMAAARGELSLGNLTLYVVVFRQGQQAFQSCLAAIGGLYEHNLYMSNLFEFMEIPIDRVQAIKPTISDAIPHDGIYFDHVSFKYPNRDNWTLHNVVLHIPKGESVAVVGSNGAGKSTLIKLLCGLYQPTQGAIFLDGKNLREWAQAELLKRMSLVFQDFNKYQLSLKENVGVGEVLYMEDEKHVASAMTRAGAAELLEQMPQGLQSSLGNWFKGGVELSGGQWQKIAVSRAFMREDADILILDEPTAALDPEAESAAFQKFHDLTKGKTSLIISHRFPIARLADHIVVIEKGEIQEEGSHAELMSAGGRYAQLFNLQAKGYF